MKFQSLTTTTLLFATVAFINIISGARGEYESAQSKFVYSTEVKEALARGGAVVALESTIISHGMPWPQNLEAAKLVENTVRSNGATPATIAIIKGVVHIGLEGSELEDFARTGRGVAKVSRRDIATVVARGASGATTVAATSLLAARAGIRVFVTGGIGGVHRGAATTMDISADLTELGRTPICVVSAGIKAFLDAQLTLEVLETQGVTVAAYRTDELPAFYTPHSGIKAPTRFDSAEECARAIRGNEALELGSGILVTVPIPEDQAPDGKKINDAILEALADAEAQGVHGKEITPFVLGRIVALTGGKSLDANIALVKNNAAVGAQIAVAYARLAKESNNNNNKEEEKETVGIKQKKKEEEKEENKIVIFGGAIIDVITRAATKVEAKTTSSGTVHVAVGGVGRNIAEALTRLGGVNPLFVTVVGKDSFGAVVLERLRSLGVSVRGVITLDSGSEGGRTAVCTDTMDYLGEATGGICDVDVFGKLTPEMVARFEDDVARAKMVVFDGNLSPETMAAIVAMAKKHGVPTVFEPTAADLSTKVVAAGLLGDILYVSPNDEELGVMAHALSAQYTEGLNMMDGMDQCRALVRAGARNIIWKRGPEGATAVTTAGDGSVEFAHFPPPTDFTIVNVVGAGDNFLSAVLWGMVEKGLTLKDAMPLGTKAARLAIQAKETVSPLLSEAELMN